MQLHRDKKPLEVALLLILCLVAAQGVLFSEHPAREVGILGGPLPEPRGDATSLAARGEMRAGAGLLESRPLVIDAQEGGAGLVVVPDERLRDEATLTPGRRHVTQTSSAAMTSAAISDQAQNENEPSPLPDLKDYFIKPTTGFNWGKIHPHNAVDIANLCGTTVVAAEDGLVSDISTDDWSGGYGRYVTLEHSNGTKTRYAHLNDVGVAVGDYLTQGKSIGTMGETGDATGCHLHFEVYGAKNPFGK